MPEAAKTEHNTVGEAVAQGGNTVSSSGHESSKPMDLLEVSHDNDALMRPPERFPSKGKSTKSYLK